MENYSSLLEAIEGLRKRGYTEDFKAGERGLLGLQHEKIYEPGQVQVNDFFRFEGASDPADNSILYAIETDDGIKGTLVDAYGPYADPKVISFMEEVERLHKKVSKDDAAKN